MNTRTCCAYGSILLAFACSAVAAPVSDEVALRVAQAFETAWAHGPQLGDSFFFMREAGGAYLPEIVPSGDVDLYQDVDRRRMAVGAFAMNLLYASAFRQAQPAARFGQAACALLAELGHPWPEAERRFREALERIDDPGADDGIRLLLAELTASSEWRDLLDDPDGLALLADATYGYLVEGLYLAVEIAALSNYHANYVRFVADMRNALMAFEPALRLFAEEPALAILVARSARPRTVAALLETLGDYPDVGADQIKAIRPLAAQARNAFAR